MTIQEVSSVGGISGSRGSVSSSTPPRNNRLSCSQSRSQQRLHPLLLHDDSCTVHDAICKILLLGEDKGKRKGRGEKKKLVAARLTSNGYSCNQRQLFTHHPFHFHTNVDCLDKGNGKWETDIMGMSCIGKDT